VISVPTIALEGINVLAQKTQVCFAMGVYFVDVDFQFHTHAASVKAQELSEGFPQIPEFNIAANLTTVVRAVRRFWVWLIDVRFLKLQQTFSI
jgi:hypothetical protein